MQPKMKLLRILDILLQTDETHPITAPAICKRLEELGISAERKSVCRDINTLIEYGYEIVLCHDNKLGYYMKNADRPSVPATPVTLDLVRIKVQFKPEDANDVREILGKGKESEEDGYIVSELGVPSSNLFANLFNLGTQVKLIEPDHLKDSFENKLAELSEFYKKRQDTKKIDVWLL